jgi:hypothetical protein
MITHSITGTKPYVLHAPGKPEFLPRKEEIFSLHQHTKPSIGLPDDLTIITFNNRQGSLLEDCLGDTRHIVLGRDVVRWSHHLKLLQMYQCLPTIATPFVMVLDAYDVLILRDLAGVLEEFKEVGCRALFNGEIRDWPEDLDHEVRAFDQKLLKEGVARNYCRHLNAGAWLAETAFAAEIVNKAIHIEPMTKHTYSEQARIKCCYPDLYPDMLVDYDCRIFININRLNTQIDIPVLL